MTAGPLPAQPAAAAATGPAGADGSGPLAVQTDGLAKRFKGGQLAVAGIDLAVPAGAVYGFLGPNGSGKTTTIRMLLGLAAPTAGRVRLFGAEMPGAFREVLPRVGALVEGPAFYPFLSGAANLARLDAANPTASRRSRPERIDAALHRVGLTAAAQKRYRAYSLGMRQRLGIAAALLCPRELLVLDEPTNGLDPQGTREVRGLVRSLAGEGLTVLLSSHLLSEVEQVCTHAGVMNQGRLVAQGTLAELRRVTAPRVRVETPDAGLAADVLTGLGLSALATPSAGTVSAELGTVAIEDACAALVAAGVRVRGLAADRASLEDVYVGLTGEGFDVAR